MTVMKRFFYAVAIILIISVGKLSAQTATLVYEYNKPLTEVQTYIQEIKIDNTVLATVPTCVATSAQLTTCSVATPSLATGTHNVSIAATKNGITAQTVISGIGGVNNPANPSNPKVTITITVNVGS